MKRILSLAAVLCVMLAVLAACGGGGFKNNVAVSDLADKGKTAIASAENLVSVDASYINGMMQMDVSDYEEYSVNINAFGIIIDEFGIFKGENSKQAVAIEEAVKGYLQRQKDNWIPEYLPEEFPKLEAAECRVFGNYVVYAVLSDSERAEFFSAIESGLK